MGLLDILDGNTVYFDTAPIIYYVEDVALYADLLEPVFQAVKSGSLSGLYGDPYIGRNACRSLSQQEYCATRKDRIIADEKP